MPLGRITMSGVETPLRGSRTCAGGTERWRRWTSSGQGRERLGRTRGLIVAAAPDDLLGAGAVVGGEDDQGVLQRPHHLDLVQDPADLLVHPVDHRGVDRHLCGLKGLLFPGQVGPGTAWPASPGPICLLPQFRFGKVLFGIVFESRADKAESRMPSSFRRSHRCLRITPQPSEYRLA